MQSVGQTNLSQLSADWLMILPIPLLFVQMSRCLLQPPKLARTMQSVTLMVSCRPPVFLSNGRTQFFSVFVCVYLSVCVCLCWKRVKIVYMSVSVKIYCWRQSRGCQVVGPIKGRSPLLTPEGTWFLTKEEKAKGAISWLKTEWWMNEPGGMQFVTLLWLYIYNTQIFYFFSSVHFYFIPCYRFNLLR